MALRKIIVLCLLAVGTRCQLSENLQEVQLRQGKITGVREDAGNGRFYYSFKGIPYAEPPIGELRFQNPVPSGEWSGQRDGSQTPPECPQYDVFAFFQGKIEILGREDCLYLNVYTPKLDASDLPVMAYIHGGAFLLGSVRDISPVPLVTEDVVLVTFHYRVGTLGFLSTEDSVMPGNLGLKDQTMALRWIHDNIRDLGGDPNRVTIFGTSAGSASIHLQVLTPYASGLFNRAILQSGTAMGAWATRKGHRQVAVKAGQLFNCSGVGSSAKHLDSNALLQCLRTAPIDKLVVLPHNFAVWSQEPLVMSPRIDGDYLPDEAEILLMQGRHNKVDLIAGMTAHDGAISTSLLYSNDALMNSLVQNFSKVGPVVLDFLDDETPEYLARTVFNHYLGEIKINDENADTVTQLATDRLFNIPKDNTVQLDARDILLGNELQLNDLQHRGQCTRFPAINTNRINNLLNSNDALRNSLVQNDDTITQLFTDRLFGIPNDYTAQLHSRDFASDKEVYMYELHHRGQYTRFPAVNSSVADNWVGHGDEVQYLFDSVSGNQQLERPADLTMRHIISKLWTNFAKTGDPTPDQSLGFRWWPVRGQCLRHLRLKEVSAMYTDQRTQIRNFWTALPTRQNILLFPDRFGFYPSPYSLDYKQRSYCP